MKELDMDMFITVHSLWPLIILESVVYFRDMQ